jgi:hypothetical protein
MTLIDALVFASGVLAGAIAALKIIAPRTATKKDDRALEILEKVDAVLPDPPAAKKLK